jgi:hypothetical protein
MTKKRSFLPTHEEIEALERQVAEADPPIDTASREKLEEYKRSFRKHGRYLRWVPFVGAGAALAMLYDSPTPWWSTAIAAALFCGAGWLWGERLALLRYRQLLEREVLPAREPLQLAGSGSGLSVAVPADAEDAEHVKAGSGDE